MSLSVGECAFVVCVRNENLKLVCDFVQRGVRSAFKNMRMQYNYAYTY